MKRIFALLISLLIAAISVFPALASEAVSFSCGDVSCDKNRLFYVEVRARSTDPISAATFEFTYDKNLIEFRGVSTDDASIVRANELENSVMAVYLCSDGKNIQSEAALFKIQFKSVDSGSCYVNFTVSDCVDSNVEKMPVGECSAALVTVSAFENSSPSGASKSNASSNSSGKNSGKTGKEGELVPSTYDEFGFLNGNIDDNSTKMFIVGIVCGAVLIILLIVAFFAGKHIAEKKTRENPQNKQ